MPAKNFIFTEADCLSDIAPHIPPVDWGIQKSQEEVLLPGENRPLPFHHKGKGHFHLQCPTALKELRFL